MRLFPYSLFRRPSRRKTAPRSAERAPSRRRLEVETLDQRIVPTVTVVPSASNLFIIGDNNPDVVSVRILSADPSSVTLGVFNNSLGTGAPISTSVLTSPSPQIPILDLATIHFTGNGGDDSFTNLTPLDSFLDGGPGNNRLTGGPGTDTVVASGDINFTLADTALISSVGRNTLVNIDAARLTGGDHANTLDASQFHGNVTLDGGDGADLLRGGAGNDLFIIGRGNQRIDGGPGTNRLQVQADGTITLTNTSLVSALGTATLSRIQRATLTGGPGNDILDASAFTGSVTLSGGAGNDLLQGGAGNDSLRGGDDDDVLVRSGGVDTLDGGPGHDVIFGLVSGPLSSDQLTAPGNLRVALVGNTLTLAGPSGAGFSIVGNWTHTTSAGEIEGTFSDTFTATGTLTLKSAAGDLPFVAPSFAPLKITTGEDDLTNFGIVASINWNNSIDTSAAGNTLTAVLSPLFGISLKTPSVKWGVALGRDLHSLHAPLNDAVPYIFYSVNNFQATIGGETVPVLDGHPLTVVIDPSDPFIYVNIEQPLPSIPVGGAFGASMQGRIPFTPAQTVPGVTEQIFGHAYGKGIVTLPMGAAGAATVKLEGETVLDLDANRDGSFINLNGQPVSNLFTGLALPGALSDLRLGSNATLTFSAEVPALSFLGTLTLPVAQATAFLSPTGIAFKARTLDPLQDTLLSFINPSVNVDVSGSIQTNGNFSFHLGFSHGSFFTFPTSNQFIDIDNNHIAVSVDVVSVPFFGTVNFSGSIDGAGHFSLTGSVDNELVPQPSLVSLTTHAALTLSNTSGHISLTATVGGRFVNGVDDFANLHASLTMSVTVTPTSSGLNISGTGTATGGITLPFVGDLDISTTFTVDNDGFTIQLLPFLPALEFSF